MATNEMDEYAQAHAANADEAEAAAGVELEANAEDAADNGQAAPAADKNAGVSPKQKKMVLGGAAVGFVLLGALVVGNIMGGSGDGVAVAQYDQGNGANAFMDQGGVLANPAAQGPQGAAPLFDGQEPQTQLSINDLIAQGAVGQGPSAAPGIDAMAVPGAPVSPTAPAAPAPFPSPAVPEPAPAVMTAAPASVAPAIAAGPLPSAVSVAPAPVAPTPVAPLAAAPGAVPAVTPALAPSMPAPAPATESVLSQQQTDEINKLRADNTTLRSQVADLKRQVDQIRKQVAATNRPADAPASASAPAPSRPAAATTSSRAADVASTTRTPQPQRNAGATRRGDFEIYAVTDGRVWVVGKDGERLGPLVVGSPLTDGSKITGIDVGRGVVMTSTGEIH